MSRAVLGGLAQLAGGGGGCPLLLELLLPELELLLDPLELELLDPLELLLELELELLPPFPPSPPPSMIASPPQARSAPIQINAAVVLGLMAP